MFPLRLALCILFLLTIPVLGSTQKIADRIYYGGEIVTADDANPQAQAIAVKDGRIIGVGGLAGIVRMRGADTELFDLEGRTLAPGFVDAYGQLSRTGFQAICANLLPPPGGHSRSIADIVRTLRKWKDERPWPRRFGLVLGFGYDDSQFAETSRLTRNDLDSVSTGLPVIAIHRSGNRSVFNGRALALAGFGGRAPDGTDGVLEGTVHDFALRRVLGTLAEGNIPVLIDAAQQLYVRFGHTTAQDSAPGPEVLEAYSEIASNGRLRIDVVAYPDPVRDGHEGMPGPLRSRNYINGFRIGGVLLRFADPPRSWATRRRAPWLRRVSGPLARAGAPASDAALLAGALENDWQVIARPRTARAADRFITAMRAAGPGDPRRAVLIHDPKPGPGWLRLLRELDIAAAVLAPAGSVDGKGDGKPPGTAAIGVLMNGGVPFTAAPGAPGAPPDMLAVMTAMIEQAESGGRSVPVTPAHRSILKSVTLWAARQYGEEKSKGSIAEGKLADLVILSANPLTADAEALADIQVMETIKEGETIFVRGKGKGDLSLACADSAPCFAGITAALARANSGPDMGGVSGTSANLRE